ncbi:MAG: hypothetical protein ACLGSA_00390 [Acidobacteriota bacterium]
MDTSPKASSTEKLLELIRGSGKKTGGEGTPAPQPLPSKKRWLSSLSLKGSRSPGASAKGVRLGVELTGQTIRMVKLTTGSGRSRTLEFKTVPIPEQGPDAPELSLVLRLALKDFLGKADADIWAMVPAESADLRFIQVPKTGKKQLSNAVYWTARKEAAFDDAEVVFDYEIQGEVLEKGATRLSVLAYTVKRDEFEKLRNLFLQAGSPLTGITVPSVAMRNLLRGGWLENAAQTQATLHLGGDFSRLELFSAGRLQFVRVLKGGLAAMALTLAEASKEFKPHAPTPPSSPEPTSQPVALQDAEAARSHVGAAAAMIVPETPALSAPISIEIESMVQPSFAGLVQEKTQAPGFPQAGAAAASMLLEEPKPAGLTPEEARSLLENLAGGPQSLPEGHPGRLLSTADVLEMLKPSWERLLRQVQMTFSHHAVTLGNEQVSSLSLGGPLGGDPALLEFLGQKLGVPCRHLDPLSPDNLGRLSVAAPSLSPGERQPYNLVLGLTDSDRAACNLLFTYKQKEEQDRVSDLNRIVALVWLGVAVLMGGLFTWQQTQAYLKRQVIKGLEAQLREFQPQVTMPLLLGTGSKVRGVVDNLRRFGARNLAGAVLHDVTGLTPENVKLFNISMDLGTPEEQPVSKGAADSQPKGPAPAINKQGRVGLDTLTLEGYVKGDSQILESLLSAYLVRLRTSPLLGEPSVSKRSLELTAAGEDVLRFTLSCQVRR